jgi:hypothetical protein
MDCAAMSTDPFGNPAPEPSRPPGARILQLVGISEVLVGLVLLIVGFAVDELIGGVLVASSGTLFVLARSLARRG